MTCPPYRVEFTDDASKGLDKITPPWRGRILAKTRKLAENPAAEWVSQTRWF